ncbi:MAG: aldolase/citrate lyase family protein [Myxococcales bacterium]|nr:aldolase/citrate lyase family protein [Myxococcales bacterium]
MKDNRLKRLLDGGEVAAGIWAALGSEVTVEVAGQLGYDWILLDLEHGVSGPEQGLALLRATGGHAMTSIVRVPSADDAGLFKRILDCGAEGVLVPMIRSAEEVHKVVRACRYPPQGIRGIASLRAHGYGVDFKDYLARANDEVLVMVQIETKEAVEAVDAILDVPGLDAVLVGPADLSAALGAPLDTTAAPFERAIERVLAACARTGKPAGIYCHSPQDAKRWVARGFRFVNVCNDMSLLVSGMRSALNATRDPR